jgi:putative iron-dependent peroxidase
MKRPQSAVCAEDEQYAVFLTLSMRANGAEAVRRVAAKLARLTGQFAAAQEMPSLSGAIGFGASIWDAVCGSPKPTGLEPFAALQDGPRVAPATPADIFLHIHSKAHRANFALAREVMRQLGGAVAIVEEIHGFRTLGARDLTGFVDGTENPKGDDRPGVALVGDEDPLFAGGSYVSIQRYVHDLARWEAMREVDQEAVIGRTKVEDIEMEDDVKPPTAHIARVVIEQDGEELEILRHSLPYGTTNENGLYFVAYGKDPGRFRRMLERMVLRDAAGHYDHLLDYTRPVTGAAFFVPSVDFIEGLA